MPCTRSYSTKSSITIAVVRRILLVWRTTILSYSARSARSVIGVFGKITIRKIVILCGLYVKSTELLTLYCWKWMIRTWCSVNTKSIVAWRSSWRRNRPTGEFSPICKIKYIRWTQGPMVPHRANSGASYGQRVRRISAWCPISMTRTTKMAILYSKITNWIFDHLWIMVYPLKW